MESDGSGILLSEWESGTGEGDIVHYLRDGNRLVSEQEGTFSLRNGDEVPVGKEIQWFDASDTSALDGWSTQGGGSAPSSQSASANSFASQIAAGDEAARRADDPNAEEGLYEGGDGDLLCFERKDGDLVEQSSGTTLHLQKGSDGICHGVEATVGFRFDDSSSPMQVHLLTDTDTVYTKVIG